MKWTNEMKLSQLNSNMMQVYYTSLFNPKEVLEIGVGNGFVSNILKKDYSLTTLDNDYMKGPHFPIDITSYELNYISDNNFDVILMCEVLEHISYEKVDKVLKILKKKLSKNGKLIISIPNRKKYLQLYLFKYGFSNKNRNFFIKIINLIIKIFNEFTVNISNLQYKLINRKVKFISDGEYLWELNIDKYSEKNFKNLLQKYYKIIHEERVIGNPYHK